MHSVTGKLTKPASVFQTSGESMGFGLRIGMKHRDTKTGADVWSNYECVVFAKSPNQIAFYQDNLVQGCVVTLSGTHIQAETYQSQTGGGVSLKLINGRLDFIFNPASEKPVQPSREPSRQPPARQPQQQSSAHLYPGNETGKFDDEIPF